MTLGLVPFLIGMGSCLWALIAMHSGWPEWVVCLSAPGVWYAWSQMKYG